MGVWTVMRTVEMMAGGWAEALVSRTVERSVVLWVELKAARKDTKMVALSEDLIAQHINSVKKNNRIIVA